MKLYKCIDNEAVESYLKLNGIYSYKQIRYFFRDRFLEINNNDTNEIIITKLRGLYFADDY